jgi:hypothetical protein
VQRQTEPAASSISTTRATTTFRPASHLAQLAQVWVDESQLARQDAERAARSALAEAYEIFAAVGSASSPAALLAHIGDVIRSNSFLWAETSLRTDARFNRAARMLGGPVLAVPVSWPRALLLGTVAADLYTGYASLRRRARGYPGTVSPRDWTLQHRRGAARAFDTAVALGGLLIKAAQFASTRPDLLPAPYIHDLARLQDRVPPHPWPSIRATIAEELGGHPETVFATISERRFASSSLSQLHLGIWRDV